MMNDDDVAFIYYMYLGTMVIHVLARVCLSLKAGSKGGCLPVRDDILIPFWGREGLDLPP
jgi:hypothetical protein